MNRLVLAALVGTSIAGLTAVTAQTTGKPRIGTYGFDAAGMDKAVAPATISTPMPRHLSESDRHPHRHDRRRYRWLQGAGPETGRAIRRL